MYHWVVEVANEKLGQILVVCLYSFVQQPLLLHGGKKEEEEGEEEGEEEVEVF